MTSILHVSIKKFFYLECIAEQTCLEKCHKFIFSYRNYLTLSENFTEMACTNSKATYDVKEEMRCILKHHLATRMIARRRNWMIFWRDIALKSTRRSIRREARRRDDVIADEWRTEWRHGGTCPTPRETLGAADGDQRRTDCCLRIRVCSNLISGCWRAVGGLFASKSCGGDFSADPKNTS